MAIVAFISDYHGQNRSTINCCCAATYIGLNYNFKCLLMHPQYNRSNMESVFLSPKASDDNTRITSMGIDAIDLAVKSNLLKAEHFYNNTFNFIKGSHRLDLLAGSEKTTRDQHIEIAKNIEKIIEVANTAYDLVFVDLDSGIYNEITSNVLEIADLVVINLNQNLKVLNEYFKSDLWKEKLKVKTVLTVLGSYFKDSNYTASTIKKMYKQKDEIYTIPHNTRLMDNCNRHDLYNFIFNNNGDLESSNYNFFFMHELKRFSEAIIKSLKLNMEFTEDKISKTNKKRMISLFSKF